MSNILIGRTIKSIQIAEDKMAIKFITDSDDVVMLVDADCCSHTWVEHVELPALGFPALVIDVVDLDMNKEDEWNDYDLIQYYGCKITTDKGDIVIDYRNSSNGYYGGSIVWPDENGYFYGGVYGQNISENKWIDVTKDI
jgi:hypothetical protein